MSKKILFLNSISGTVLYVTNVIVAFIMSPVLVRTLGNTDFGVWEMVVGVVGYMGILDLGIGGALLRQVAMANSKDDQQDLQETISTAMAFFLAVGVLVILIFLVLSYHPMLLLGSEQSVSDRLGVVFLLFAINAGFIFPLNVFIAVLMGFQQHYFINSSRVVLTILRAIAAYYFLVNFPQMGLFILVVLELVSNMVQFFIYGIKLRIDDILHKFSILKCTKKKILELFGYGGKSALLLISSRVQYASMPFIVGKALGMNMIVYYALPNRLVDYAKGFALAIGFPLTPFFANLLGQDDQEALKAGWLTTAFVLQGITLAMPLFLCFCGENFIKIWIGSEYASMGRYVLYALIAGLVAEAISPNARQVLLATNRHGRPAVFALAMSICSVPLSFLGGKLFGVPGAALGCSFATIVISLFILYRTCIVMETSLFEYMQKTTFPFFLPLLLLGGVLWGTGELWRPDNYLKLILQVAFGAIGYFGSIWVIVLPVKIRREISAWTKLKFYKVIQAIF